MSGILICIIFPVSLLILSKKILITSIWADRYEVQGVDVSHYQGEVNWSKIQQAGISFAFIKATEGSRSVDERFLENWQDAAETDLCIGAYHFFQL